MTKPVPAPGLLLVSAPTLLDPNFNRTVVLLCEHDESGTFGLVVNRPLDLHLEDVLDGFGYPSPPLRYGGPVQPETLHYLHRRPDLLPESQLLRDGIYWGGDFDLLRAHFGTGLLTGTDVRFFLGYAGWSAGQLGTELREPDWVLTPAIGADLFATEPDALWHTIMRRLGPPHAYLVHYPEDLRTN